jgi:hypothetical protein
MKHQRESTSTSPVIHSSGVHAVRGDAVRHLADLLGHMHVDRHRHVEARGRVHQLGEHEGVDGAHRMRRDAEAQRRVREVEVAQLGHQLQDERGIAAEAALRRRKRAIAERAVRIQHRHQREGDAGVRRGGEDAMGHLGAVGIGLALPVAVDVVELAHGRIAVLQHLDVEVPRDRFDVLGLEVRDQAIHLLAPGPEVVGGMPAEFREARHGALERVRVDVGHAGKHGARRRRRRAARLSRLRTREHAALVPFEQHVARPSVREQRVRCEEGRHFFPIIRPWRISSSPTRTSSPW